MDVPLNSDMLKRLPLIVVLGATGTGKSKLAVQLAKMYNGEVISADSMQVYRGLDIVTNKVTEEEADGVTHHCLNFLDPLTTYTVVDFRDTALPIIERLMSEGKLPVVVGGTHYYIESLLWKVLVSDGEAIAEVSTDGPLGVRARMVLLLEELEYTISTVYGKPGSEGLYAIKDFLGVFDKGQILDEIRKLIDNVHQWPEEEVSKILPAWLYLFSLGEQYHPEPSRLANRKLHARLKEVDPERALRLHYNDVRKVKRSLEIFEKSQTRHSDLLRQQREAEGGCELGGPLRYPNTAIFWIRADQAVLDKRLDDRVDDMMARGLLKELEDFHRQYNEARLKDNSTPYTQGIFQTIGFKEFHPYLTLPDKTVPEAATLLQGGINSLKLATRRYARRQIKWIRGRFLKDNDRQVPPVYGLDATDPKEWDEKVLNPAVAVIRSFLGEEVVPPLPLPKEKVALKRALTGERLCRVCMRIFVGDHQWEAHLKSKKHYAMVKRKERQHKLY